MGMALKVVGLGVIDSTPVGIELLRRKECERGLGVGVVPIEMWCEVEDTFATDHSTNSGST